MVASGVRCEQGDPQNFNHVVGTSDALEGKKLDSRVESEVKPKDRCYNQSLFYRSLR